MTNKRIRLPKQALVEPEDVRSLIDGTTDVEGHSWVNPAPPTEFGTRTPSQGGELRRNIDDEDADFILRIR